MKYTFFILLIFLINIDCLTQGIWVKDSLGCQFYDPYGKISEKSTYSWSGDCQNGYVNGNGVLKKHLNGKLFVTFIGELKNGKYSNNVKWYFSNNNIYVGQFDTITGTIGGFGKYTYFNGDYYEGEWQNDLMSGKGIYKYKNGSYYDGFWKNSDKDGIGKMVSSDSIYYNGIWERDILISRSVINDTLPFVPQDSSIKYLVNPLIKNEIEHILNDKDSLYNGIIELSLYMNDKMLISKDSMRMPFFIINEESSTDKRVFLCYSGMFNALGFEVNLFNNKCQLFYFVKSDLPEVYKLYKNDNIYSNSVFVPCKSKKITLVNAPKYTEGEIIEGIVELQSFDFYEKNNDGIDNKYNVDLKAYFTTKEKKK